jgi:hypothetical protein
VKVVSTASFNPELNVLLSAELDALAKYWTITQNFRYSNSTERFGKFLARHAGPAWGKCSHGNLLKRAAEEARTAKSRHRPRAGGLPDPIRQETELDRILHRLLGPLLWSPAVISWKDDPDLLILLQQEQTAAGGITADWLRRSRYGEILYRHYRSGWIHALDPHPELHTEYHHISILSILRITCCIIAA